MRSRRATISRNRQVPEIAVNYKLGTFPCEAQIHLVPREFLTSERVPPRFDASFRLLRFAIIPSADRISRIGPTRPRTDGPGIRPRPVLRIACADKRTASCGKTAQRGSHQQKELHAPSSTHSARRGVNEAFRKSEPANGERAGKNRA
jgi:hypothetical protein